MLSTINVLQAEEKSELIYINIDML